MDISNRHHAARSSVLAWYHDAARDLPWRVTPAARARGVMPNAYHVWLSEIMLQQTTVATVKSYFAKFTSIWPTVSDLAVADRDDVMAAWAGLGYYARARNLHKTAQLVTHDYGGVFPQDEDTLRSLPGIGAYTAAAISAFAFGRHAVVVDGNIERITSRWDAIKAPLPKAKPECYAAMAELTPDPDADAFTAGDFAQALMDIGTSICTAARQSSSGLTAPSCLICPLASTCRARDDDPATYPRKVPKKPRPDRFGQVLIILDNAGHVVLTRRPDQGLLGGLDIFPTNDWPDGGGLTKDQGIITAAHPAHQLLQMFGHGTMLNQPCHHIFTHFRVVMSVVVIRLDASMPALPQGDDYPLEWVSVATLTDRALPTVMVKCARAAQIITSS